MLDMGNFFEKLACMLTYQTSVINSFFLNFYNEWNSLTAYGESANAVSDGIDRRPLQWHTVTQRTDNFNLTDKRTWNMVI